MSKPLRLTVIVAGIVLALAALGYAAHAMNIIGLLVSVHTAPPH
jgi:hypothetical protein